jgi:hypothetical protein
MLRRLRCGAIWSAGQAPDADPLSVVAVASGESTLAQRCWRRISRRSSLLRAQASSAKSARSEQPCEIRPPLTPKRQRHRDHNQGRRSSREVLNLGGRRCARSCVTRRRPQADSALAPAAFMSAGNGAWMAFPEPRSPGRRTTDSGTREHRSTAAALAVHAKLFDVRCDLAGIGLAVTVGVSPGQVREGEDGKLPDRLTIGAVENSRVLLDLRGHDLTE